MRGTCHCGQVSIAIKYRPDFVNDCNCSLCSKSGTWWGYFEESEVSISGTTTIYTRVDREAPAVEKHFCSRCGVTTHWNLKANYAAHSDRTSMGVNMRIFDPNFLAGVEIRFPDGANWDGKTVYSYRKPSSFL